MSTCKLCGCTDMMACPGGCHWIDPEHTICSQCGELSVELVKRLKKIAKKHSFAAYEDPKKKQALNQEFVTDVKSLLEQFEDREFEDES